MRHITTPKIVCPICQIEMTGRERFEHAKMHVLPETAERIRTETGEAIEDFLIFCLQEGIDIDGLPAKNLSVTHAIWLWKHPAT